jgi:adenosylhomocysteine nucleosidase
VNGHDSTMNILITYAVESEFAPWRELRKHQKVAVRGVEVHRAQIGQATVDFVITGMGAANAQRVAEIILSSEYSFCIASGFAGALDATCKPGEVIAPNHVRPANTSRSVVCAPNLVQGAVDDGAKNIGTMVTADHVVATAAEKGALARFGEAVDMESFSIIEVARQRNLPAVILRVISDSFDRDLPVRIDTLVDKQGNVQIGGVVRYIARHPLMVPALLRLGRDSKTAAQALAHFLEAHIEKISSTTHAGPPSEPQEVAAS